MRWTRPQRGRHDPTVLQPRGSGGSGGGNHGALARTRPATHSVSGVPRDAIAAGWRRSPRRSRSPRPRWPPCARARHARRHPVGAPRALRSRPRSRGARRFGRGQLALGGAGAATEGGCSSGSCGATAAGGGRAPTRAVGPRGAALAVDSLARPRFRRRLDAPARPARRARDPIVARLGARRRPQRGARGRLRRGRERWSWPPSCAVMALDWWTPPPPGVSPSRCHTPRARSCSSRCSMTSRRCPKVSCAARSSPSRIGRASA